MDAEIPISGAVVAKDGAFSPAPGTPSLNTAARRRVLAAICLSGFLASLNFFAPTPFYPEMARDLGTTVPLLGQVVTLMALLSAAMGVIIGPFADRYGYRRPLVVGLLAIALGLAGTGLAPAYPVLLGLGALGGFGDALAFALPFAIATTTFSGDARRRAIGWTIAALSAPPIVGVPILTAIGGTYGWRMALIVAGAAGLAIAAFVAVALPADHRQPESPPHVRTLLVSYAPLRRHGPSLRLLAVSALRGIWWVGILTYLGAFLGTVAGLDAREVGLAYALAGAGYAAASVAAGGRLGARAPRATVVGANVLAAAFIPPMLLLPQTRMVLPLLLAISVVAAATSVGVVALLAAESPIGAGATMVLNGAVLNVGTAGGAVFCGLLIAMGGYAALAVGLPGFALLAAVLAWWPARVTPGR